MTLNVALGVPAPATPVKTPDRSIASQTNDRGFEQALDARPDKRKPQEVSRSDDMDTVESWKTQTAKRDVVRAEPGDDALTPANGEEDAFSLLLDETLQSGTSDADFEDGIVLDEPTPAPDDESDIDIEDIDATDPAIVLLQALAPNDQIARPGAADPNAGDIEDRSPVTSRSAVAATGLANLLAGETGEQRDRGSRQGNRPGAQPLPQAPSTGSDRTTTIFAAEQTETEGEISAKLRTEYSTSSRGNSTSADGNSRNAPTTQPAGHSTAGMAGRVDVVSFTTTTTPSSATIASLNPTTAGLLSAIEGEASWRSAALDSSLLNGMRGASQQSGFSSLRIQLNPVELGMVTARLTATGSQLEVEIEVESNDARQRLTTDSDTIVRALRSLGYDVEKVTIQQAPQNQPSAGQQGTAGSGTRDQPQAEQQPQDGAGARRQGNQGTERDGQAGGHGLGDAAAERGSGGIYI